MIRRIIGTEMVESILERIEKWGRETPDKTAVCDNHGSITYSELVEQIHKRSTELLNLGIGKQDRVMIVAKPVIQYVVTYFALNCINAVCIPVGNRIKSKQLEGITNDISPSFFISGYEDNDTGIICEKKERITSSSVGDVIEILYTTGTTGESKGVMLTNRNLVAGAENVAYGGGIKTDDVNLLPAPLHHAFGLASLRGTFYSGATLVLQDGFTSIKEIFGKITKYKVTAMYLVPSAVPMMLVQTGNNLGALLRGIRKLEFGTAPLDDSMRKILMEQLPGVHIYNAYGATEASRSIYMDITDDMNKLSATGKAAVNTTIKIANPENQDEFLRTGEIGRIVVFGPMVMEGYFGNEELTEQVIHDGGFYSSDIGYVDDDGFVYLLGRDKDIFNIGGEKVSPKEIENIAYDSNIVRECACVDGGDSAKTKGSIPVLFVVYKDKTPENEKALKTYMTQNLERIRLPGAYVTCDELPRNYMGKLEREKLRIEAKQLINLND